jgi:hypothetical protein
MPRLALLLFLLVPAIAIADEDPDPWISMNVLILKSTKKYPEAKATAEKAAKDLGLKLDLEDYEYNAESGLSMTPEGCKESAFDFPCYVARGRELEKTPYISVEYSSAYPTFGEGLYIVVASVAKPKDKGAEKLLEKVRKSVPDAYLKRTKVYLGCMH